MLKTIILLIATFIGSISVTEAQDKWQQRVKYKMDVLLDATTNMLKGKQSIEYTNNSPDTLYVLFYHMYWNAFQPNSMMDVRSRELGKIAIDGRTDWDYRVADRISKLKPDETGYQKIITLKMNGRVQETELRETILKVKLDKPIPPKAKVILDADFEARVPIQIRRSGRENEEGVKFSMAQWYPKLAEYDAKGWHPNPYIGREFYGVWGDFDVNITLDKNFVVAGTGYLANANEIGYGYEAEGVKVNRPSGNLLTWKFTAPNVHDFVWAADPEYKHITKKIREGLTIHVFYKISPLHLQKYFSNFSPRMKGLYNNNAGLFIRNYEDEWQQVADNMVKAFPYIESQFGKYPYKQFSFIQGGDGGMEYPMATLLKGAGESVVYHELLHSWFPMIMSNNESLTPWIDEGFASYAEGKVVAFLKSDTSGTEHKDNYAAYVQLARTAYAEPLTTHADQYKTNYGYSRSSYSKGAVFYEQLGYIIGRQNLHLMFLELYRKFRFRHVDQHDILRVAESVSGMQLGWYGSYFVNTTNTINYGIDSLWQEGNKIKVRMKNTGQMPMPIDLMITFKDGSKHLAHIPQYLSFGNKPAEDSTVKRTVHEPWKATHPTYTVELDGALINVQLAEIDPSQRMADVNRNDNRLEIKW
jgi:hypothetical protein